MSPARQEDFSSAMSNAHSSDNSESSNSSSESECEELKEVRAAVVPRAANATPQEVRQVYSQTLLTIF